MVRNDIAKLIVQAIKRAQQEGELPRFEIPLPIPFSKPVENYDYSTAVCLQLARLARMAPVAIAHTVVKQLPEADFIGQVEVARPGFLNILLDNRWVARQVETILQAGENWGNVNLGQGQRVQVEFISANPTGPLTMGSGRNAVLGDTLANVLSAAGYQVQREYYVNDAGTQMRLFTETLYARYAQALGRDEPVPEAGYQGYYMIELGQQVAAEEGDRFLRLPREEALVSLQKIGLSHMLSELKADAAALGIHFDRWFSEQSLYDDGVFGEVMTLLRQGGYIEEREGAVWFKATALGGDKDEVIIRSDGTPGYFASDIAYHYDKFVRRGFDRVIDVWGADHQGHVPRMKAMMRALGLDPERLTLLLYQLVTLRRGGELVRLSKRTGDIITLREVIEEVGADAVRFFLLARSADSQMDFDLELARQESAENPVYYVQYGHARICSILRHAAERGWTPERYADGDVSLLTHPMEQTLIRKMLLLPEVVELAAETLSPHYLTYYAQELATAFHAFYRDCRVVSADPADENITAARLRLALAARLTLGRALRLMGVSAPERM